MAHSTATADRPKLIAKRQTTLGEGLDNRILSLYGKGLSYEDIQAHLEDLYGLEISTGQLSAITDKILPVVEQWRSRPLEAVYAFVWLDAVHRRATPFKVRQDGKVISKAAYNVLAVDLQAAAARGVKICWVYILGTPRVRVSGCLFSLTCKVEGLKIC